MTPTIPPVADDEAMRIAGTLTKAQRDAIRKAEDGVYGGVFGTLPFRNRLARQGLCSFDSRAGRGASWLSPLGERVRAALQNREAGDE